MVILQYQIKGNDLCINMVANSLPIDPIPGVDKNQLFQNMVMLHIKLRELRMQQQTGTYSVLTLTLDH